MKRGFYLRVQSELGAEIFAQYLSGRIARDGINEANATRLFEAAEAFSDIAADVGFQLGRRRDAFPKDDKRIRNFACAIIRLANHTTVTDGRMFEQDGFNFG